MSVEGPRLRPKITTLVTTFTSGGVVQAAGEALTLISNRNPEKFPRGWESFNLPEEILEGGISATAGAIAGKFLYFSLCTRGKLDYSEREKTKFMFFGACAGYISMAAIIGPVLHQITGASDVKWGPFH